MTPPRIAIALLVLLAALAIGAVASNNGTSRPLNGHEIFVAETASEMMERGDYLVPYYNGELRLQKPPLAYWLSIIAHKVFGKDGDARVTELESRLPSLASGMLLLIVTFMLGKATFDDWRMGLVAAAILATSWCFFKYSRSARPEMLYALFCTAQMLGLMIAVRRAEQGRPSTPGALTAWLATAGALLAKGPQFPIFFLAGTILALWIRVPRPVLGQVLQPVMGILSVSLVLPYFAYLIFQTDGVVSFWSQEIVQNTPTPLWLRPFRLYVPWTVVLSLVPWIVMFGIALVYCWKRRHPGALILVFGILVSLFFLSFTGKLRQHYVLPLMPLVAVLAAWASVELYDRARREERLRRIVKRLIASQAALVGLLLGAIIWFAQAENPVGGMPMWRAATPWLLFGALFLSLALAFLARRPALAFGALVCSLLSASTAIATSGLDTSRYWSTAAEFAVNVAKVVPAEKPIVFHGIHSDAVIYYARRKGPQITLDEWVSANGTEDPPLFICRKRCSFDGYEVEGRVLFQQRDLARRRYMILFKPSRVRLRAKLSRPDERGHPSTVDGNKAQGRPKGPGGGSPTKPNPMGGGAGLRAAISGPACGC